MRNIAFSSEDLPEKLDDRARVSAWQDFLAEVYAPIEVSGPSHQPFWQRLLGSRFEDSSTPVDVLRLSGAGGRMAWTSRAGRTPRATDFVLCFNRQSAPLSLTQLGREVQLTLETAAIMSCAEPADLCYADPHDFSVIVIDQLRLRELVDQVEDMVASPLPPSPALRHLRRYLEILPTQEEAEAEPDLLAHIGTTLTGLVALALGAGRDAAEFANKRGLRAARQVEIIRVIRARFTDPDFSAQQLAVQMGVTDRYIQDLLQESGASFSQRVLELRLQRARAMLQDRRHDRLNINEVANASGFNAIPYFNRCFRRRFGTAPRDLRCGRAAR